MKTILKIIPIAICILLISQPGNAQNILKKLKNNAQNKIEQKIEERIEKKVDEKIDKEIDKGLDKIEESLERNSDSTDISEDRETLDRETRYQNRMQNILKSAGIGGEPVPIENQYSFTHLIQMHISSFSKEGEQTSDGELITHFDATNKNMAYEVLSGDIGSKEAGMFIIDSKNNAMILLSEENGEKKGMVYGTQSFFSMMGETYEEEVDLSDTPETWMANPNVKKTGKTKTIAGFDCEEYIYTDENTESEIWITKDMKLNSQDFLSALFKTSLASHGMGWGYMMESTSIDKETGEKSVMKVTKVDKNSKVNFDLNAYQITNLGNISIPTE